MDFYQLARRLVSAENRSQELANCVSTPLICQKFPGLRPWNPSSIRRAPFMRYVHKGCSQVRLTAHIVHEWINVSEISHISIFQSCQLCCESIRIPRYLTYFASSIPCLLIRIATTLSGLFGAWEITKLDFETFNDNRFMQSQS